MNREDDVRDDEVQGEGQDGTRPQDVQPAETEPAEARPVRDEPVAPSRARRRGATALRGVTGLLVLGLAGGTAWAADLLPVEETAGVAAQELAVVPSAVDVVCPGPVQLADPDASADPAFDPSPVGTTTSFGGVVLAPATVGPSPVTLLDGSAAPAVATAAGRSLVVARGAVPGATTLTAAPASDGAAVLGASVVSSTTAGDLRGLAGASCATPSAEQWLLGGTTTRGSSTRLVVQNPSRTAAVVDVELWGPGGRIDAAGPTTMTVPAGGQSARLLEAVAPEQRLLGVRVVARGALVTSYLQVGVLDGIRPLGVDLAAATTPATRQVVTGVTTTGPGAGARLDVLVPDGSDPTLAAGSDATTTAANPVAVSVTVLGPQGRVLVPGAEQFETVPGQVVSLDLDALEAGRYTLVVDAPSPLVASVTSVRPGTDGDDRALLAGRPAPGPGVSLAASPAGVRRTLTLTAVPDDLAGVPGAALGTGVPVDADGQPLTLATRRVEVDLVGTDGQVSATFPVDVPVGGTAVVGLDARAPGVDVAAVVVRPTGEGPDVTWSLEASADGRDGTVDGLLTVLAPVPGDVVTREVVVRPSLGF
ncbi:DUF5719 family protein [Sanguibacter sp. HDW7]|uniref:DUF5719 family protein n=1 Tax=Sanguibacter sp. HDW7 TaxID=2714931 RepID=UPI00140D231E|nr:DUF5719 family protein [Sanguibacter sp. HDW7]QIK82851.1 hypothetical protein G7063_03830 [Sanguibacter sp. HDW7]